MLDLLQDPLPDFRFVARQGVLSGAVAEAPSWQRLAPRLHVREASEAWDLQVRHFTISSLTFTAHAFSAVRRFRHRLEPPLRLVEFKWTLELSPSTASESPTFSFRASRDSCRSTRLFILPTSSPIRSSLSPLQEGHELIILADAFAWTPLTTSSQSSKSSSASSSWSAPTLDRGTPRCRRRSSSSLLEPTRTTSASQFCSTSTSSATAAQLVVAHMEKEVSSLLRMPSRLP